MAKQVADIRYDEWIKALSSLRVDGPKGFTVREAQQVIGKTEKATRTALRELMDAGLARCAGTRRTTNIAGYSQQTPVYALVKR